MITLNHLQTFIQVCFQLNQIVKRLKILSNDIYIYLNIKNK